MKLLKTKITLLILLFINTVAFTQIEGFHHEFPIVFNDSVSMFFQQNTVQISDSTFFTGGNYGYPFSNAGMVITDTSGAVLIAKYIGHSRSFDATNIIAIDSNKIVYCGSFEEYHETTGAFKDRSAGLLCVDLEGNVLWEKYYGEVMSDGYPYPSDYSEEFFGIVVDDIHQKLYCYGGAFSYDSEHEGKPYVVCTDFDGNTLWTWAMPDIVNQNRGLFTDVLITENEELICVGQIVIYENKGYNGKNLIVKLSHEGEQLWSKLWGVTNVYSAGVANIGNEEFVVVAEESEIFSGDITYGTIYKFSTDGDSINKKTFLKNQNSLWVRDVVPVEEGFAILGEVGIGSTNDTSAIFIAKYNNSLEPLSIKAYGYNNFFRGVNFSFDNSLLLTGTGGNEYGNFIIKTDSKFSIPPLFEIDLNISKKHKLREIVFYPNPVHNQLIIESPDQTDIGIIKIYDINGCIQFESNSKKTSTTLNLQNLTSGLYILTVNGITTGKLLIQQ